MAETKINANQTNITASDIGAASTAQLAGKQDIMQYETLPGTSGDVIATEEWYGKTIQYTGADFYSSSGDNFTIKNGFFLACKKKTTGTPQIAYSMTGAVTSVSATASKFVSSMQQYIPDADVIGDNVFTWNSGSWQWVLTYMSNGVQKTKNIGYEFPSFEAEEHGLTALGITVSPSELMEQSGSFTLTVSGLTNQYYWGKVNVDCTAVANNSTNSQGISLFGNGDTKANSINIGYNSSASKGSYGDIAVGDHCNVVGSTASYSGRPSIGIGNSITVAGPYNIAIGGSIFKPDAYTEVGCCVVIGKQSYISTDNSDFSTVIGYNAVSEAFCAIQLGSRGDNVNRPTNSDANTFKVANQNGNFEIMSANGTIPTDRFTTTPTTDGTYVPSVTVSNGVATRAWDSRETIVDLITPDYTAGVEISSSVTGAGYTAPKDGMIYYFTMPATGTLDVTVNGSYVTRKGSTTGNYSVSGSVIVKKNDVFVMSVMSGGSVYFYPFKGA